MPKIFSATGMTTGQPVEASQVSQSVDAFTGVQDYAITLSGSLTLANATPATFGGNVKLLDNSHFSQSALSASVGSNADVIMKYGSAEKFRTTNTGITVVGEVDATSFDVTSITASGDISVASITASGDISAANITASGVINSVKITASGDLEVQGNTKLGNAAADTTKITGSLHFNDGVGAVGSATMYNDGDTFFFTQSANGAKTQLQTDQLIIKNQSNSETLLIANENTDVQLFYNNVRRFATTNEGAYISGSSTSTGLEVHDGSNTSIRSATATEFDFNGDTYIANSSNGGSAKVAFAIGGKEAANIKAAITPEEDLEVYSGSVNIQRGINKPTGSYMSVGNIQNQATANSNGIQKVNYIIANKIITSTEENLFSWSPWQGFFPLPALDNSHNFSAQIKVELILMTRGSNLNPPANNIGQIVAYSVFGLEGSGYNIGEASGYTELVNQTAILSASDINLDFNISSGTDASFIRVVLDNNSGFPAGGLQAGGTVEITVTQQIA